MKKKIMKNIMKIKKHRAIFLLLMMLFLFGYPIIGCSDSDEPSHDTSIVDDNKSVVDDNIAPSIGSTLPLSDATDIGKDANLDVIFSEAMDPLTITTEAFTLMHGDAYIVGVVTYSDVTATFDPTSVLDANTLYTATISRVAKDLAGNALASDHVWSFTTRAVADTIAPYISFTAPLDTANGIAIGGNITANFSEAMDPLAITTETFILQQGETIITGAVTYSGSTGTFDPESDLDANTLYAVTITADARDLTGNTLESDYTWSFTTRPNTALGPDPVFLGLAGDFVILSKAGIDTIPASAITGNIGASPIDSTGITGFSLIVDATNVFSTSTQVIGNVYAADYAVPTPANLTTSISDMEIAYTDAAGRVTPDFSEHGAGDISGMTLVPGLYKWGTGILISSDVTLDGGPNDVWIFQIAEGITQASAAKIILKGGAQAKNVFWQVAGSVALDTMAHLEGIVLSQKDITMATGASVNGRLFAQTSVTIDACTVTQPAQ